MIRAGQVIQQGLSPVGHEVSANQLVSATGRHVPADAAEYKLSSQSASENAFGGGWK